MLIDRSHRPWLLVSTLVVVIATAAFFMANQQSLHGMSGGSLLGLVFGITGAAFMTIAMLLAVRKRLPTWRIGSAQLWLRAHLWFGTVGFILILFHSGFRLGGLLESWLWLSFGLVVVTGFAGVALQQVVPRLLMTRVPLETIVSQIPFLSKTMLFRADQLVAKHVGPLDIPFEKLKPFAEAALQQQRVLKRESDFPKELAKVYANVPLPDGDKKGAATAEGSALPPKPSPVTKPVEATVLVATAPSTTAPVSPVTEAAPAIKPKSPLELMREKAAAKAAASSTEPVVSAQAAPITTVATPEGEKKLTPLEVMRAKLDAAKSSPSDKPSDAPKPLTIEKPAASEGVDVAAKLTAPVAIKKPGPPGLKPTAGTESTASAPKPKPVVIPVARLDELRQFHVQIVRPFLSRGRSPEHRLNDTIAARRLFGQLKADLPTELHETVEQLEAFCEERRQFVIQKRLHRWLHWWLILHIPSSVAMFVLFFAHVVMALRVVPFGK